jgi:hypothetical protein
MRASTKTVISEMIHKSVWWKLSTCSMTGVAGGWKVISHGCGLSASAAVDEKTMAASPAKKAHLLANTILTLSERLAWS